MNNNLQCNGKITPLYVHNEDYVIVNKQDIMEFSQNSNTNISGNYLNLNTYNESVKNNTRMINETYGNTEYDKLEEVSVTMDENRVLEKYLDKIDTDRREQEQRMSKSIELMEQRITEERRLSEERMEKKFMETMKKVDTMNDKLDEKADKMIEKIDSNKKWIAGVCITTILSIAGMTFAILTSK